VHRSELIDELTGTLGARHEARFIVEDVAGSDSEMSAQAIEAARGLAVRRAAGEPLQYVLGHWAFRSLDLEVDPRVLIPRPETEQVVEVALQILRRCGVDDPTVVDAGTGTGAIALALATELAESHSNAQVWAIDTSPDALEVAGRNAVRVREACPHMVPVTLVEGWWLTALPDILRGTIDLVIANPPYVAESEWDQLSVEVRQEPRRALIAPSSSDGTPGLADVETLLVQGREWLACPGTIVIELAPHQADAAAALARSLDYVDVRVEPDLAQRPRALVGRTQ
jgi:release factor glutamine methyltransferase